MNIKAIATFYSKISPSPGELKPSINNKAFHISDVIATHMQKSSILSAGPVEGKETKQNKKQKLHAYMFDFTADIHMTTNLRCYTEG